MGKRALRAPSSGGTGTSTGLPASGQQWFWNDLQADARRQTHGPPQLLSPHFVLGRYRLVWTSPGQRREFLRHDISRRDFKFRHYLPDQPERRVQGAVQLLRACELRGWLVAGVAANPEHRRKFLWHYNRRGKYARRSLIQTYSFRDVLSVGSSRVDLQACKLEYSIVSPK